MKNIELTQSDIEQIERFKTGFPWMDIIGPATPAKGIKVLTQEEETAAYERAEKAMAEGGNKALKFAKFVPASGAASRMFKDLFNKNVTIVNKFVQNIENFAFYDKSVYGKVEGEALVDFTLLDEGLGYGKKPKGVLKFHRYPTEVRTAIAEHLVEAKEYAASADGVAKLVVTISPEHTDLFKAAIADVQAEYEKRYGVKYDITLVYQYEWTDTLAVTVDNEPFVTAEGRTLHRPGGHGALIHNLKEVDADIVCIKNIDNVAVESYLPQTARWKKILVGLAVELREQIFSYIEKLEKEPSDALCAEVQAFLDNKLCISLTGTADVATLLKILRRPVRVAGMVKNEGEPGGGPFLIREKDGSTSLQILEGVQINPSDAHAQECLKASTHFNPVDIVCVLKDEKGKNFNLLDFVDADAGFISSKSYQGAEIKALELPGLWNGAMSRWNTLFVEVPVETFNPVKTVMDLLRPAHQGK